MDKKMKIFIIVVLGIFIVIILLTSILIKSYEKAPLSIQQDVNKPQAGIGVSQATLNTRGPSVVSDEEENEPYVGEGPLLN